MISYAGIGTRDINSFEMIRIRTIAKQLAKKNYILYSGNAEGSDVAFQAGSNSQCVLMLPWSGFNREVYDPGASIESFDLGDSVEGLASIEMFRGQKVHPNPRALDRFPGGKRMMARNYHQVFGYRQYPTVSFVVFCANEKNGKVDGGTGQAVRLARIAGIPTFNIRTEGWGKALGEFLRTLK